MRGLVCLWGILSCRFGAPVVVFQNVQVGCDFGRNVTYNWGGCQVVIGGTGGNNRWTRILRGRRRRYRLEREGGGRFREGFRVPRSDGLREPTRERHVLRYARETSLPSMVVYLFGFLVTTRDCDSPACRRRFTRVLSPVDSKQESGLPAHFCCCPRRAQPRIIV